MKKITLLIFLVSVIVGFYFFENKPIPHHALSIRNTNIIESQQTITDRSPASIKMTNKKEASNFKQNNRQWVRQKGNEEELNQIQIKNTPTKEWQKKLVTILTRGLKPSTQVEVKHEKSLVLVNGQNGTNTEQVIVIFNGPEGRNSYRAMIDSQSAKILRTWDHTIHENIRKPASLSAFPIQVAPVN